MSSWMGVGEPRHFGPTTLREKKGKLKNVARVKCLEGSIYKKSRVFC